MQRIVIELNEENGELKFSLPPNIALTLGLLDMTREIVLNQHVRNAPKAPMILDVAGVVPPISKQ